MQNNKNKNLKKYIKNIYTVKSLHPRYYFKIPYV